MTPERTRSVLFGLALVVVLALGSRQKVCWHDGVKPRRGTRSELGGRLIPSVKRRAEAARGAQSRGHAGVSTGR